MEIRVFSTFYCVRFFFPPWDWKKRQLLVVCFDANVGYCRGATGDGTRCRIWPRHRKECFLANVPSFIQEMQRKDPNKQRSE